MTDCQLLSKVCTWSQFVRYIQHEEYRVFIISVGHIFFPHKALQSTLSLALLCTEVS
jgi:hypothetical protein